MALTLCLKAPAHAEEWNQWRGPTRDGVVPALSAPPTWPGSFARAWRVEIGEGYSSPVVSTGRVFVHSRRDPDEVVTAIDLADGRIVWQGKYPAPFEKNQNALKIAKGPHATPLVLGHQLFTLGITAMLSAWDTSTGRRQWSKDFSKTVDTSKMFCGTAASPLAVGGLVVVQTGSDVHGGQVVPLEPGTRVAKWEWHGLGPGYASPIAIEVPGTVQVVTLTHRSIVGIDAKTGGEL